MQLTVLIALLCRSNATMITGIPLWTRLCLCCIRMDMNTRTSPSEARVSGAFTVTCIRLWMLHLYELCSYE